MAEFPAFPLWTDAYLGDTTHLTTIEHGAFLLLLFTAWRTTTYDLPDDDKLLAKYCRLTPGQWARIRPTIMGYWKLKDGRWFNGRLLDERDAVRRRIAQRSDAGKASALKRFHRYSTSVQREVNEISTPTPTPTPIVIKEIDLSKFVVGSKADIKDGYTIQDPTERLNRFQKTLAEAIGRDGFQIVAQASNIANPLYARSLAICKAKAKELGKGWPHQW